MAYVSACLSACAQNAHDMHLELFDELLLGIFEFLDVLVLPLLDERQQPCDEAVDEEQGSRKGERSRSMHEIGRRGVAQIGRLLS